MYLDEARRLADDPRWGRKCSLMGCTDPNSVHDHHMQGGHLNHRACKCYQQTGEPGSLGTHVGGTRP